MDKDTRDREDFAKLLAENPIRTFGLGGTSTTKASLRRYKLRHPCPHCGTEIFLGETNREHLLLRVKDYLVGGGLFNPEMALHDRVRDLIMDLRNYVEDSDTDA